MSGMVALRAHSASHYCNSLSEKKLTNSEKKIRGFTVGRHDAELKAMSLQYIDLVDVAGLEPAPSSLQIRQRANTKGFVCSLTRKISEISG